MTGPKSPPWMPGAQHRCFVGTSDLWLCAVWQRQPFPTQGGASPVAPSAQRGEGSYSAASGSGQGRLLASSAAQSSEASRGQAGPLITTDKCVRNLGGGFVILPQGGTQHGHSEKGDTKICEKIAEKNPVCVPPPALEELHSGDITSSGFRFQSLQNPTQIHRALLSNFDHSLLRLRASFPHEIRFRGSVPGMKCPPAHQHQEPQHPGNTVKTSPVFASSYSSTLFRALDPPLWSRGLGQAIPERPGHGWARACAAVVRRASMGFCSTLWKKPAPARAEGRPGVHQKKPGVY